MHGTDSSSSTVFTTAVTKNQIVNVVAAHVHVHVHGLYL